MQHQACIVKTRTDGPSLPPEAWAEMVLKQMTLGREKIALLLAPLVIIFAGSL
jgi:hypothetical protein